MNVRLWSVMCQVCLNFGDAAIYVDPLSVQIFDRGYHSAF